MPSRCTTLAGVGRPAAARTGGAAVDERMGSTGVLEDAEWVLKVRHDPANVAGADARARKHAEHVRVEDDGVDGVARHVRRSTRAMQRKLITAHKDHHAAPDKPRLEAVTAVPLVLQPSSPASPGSRGGR